MNTKTTNRIYEDVAAGWKYHRNFPRVTWMSATSYFKLWFALKAAEKLLLVLWTQWLFIQHTYCCIGPLLLYGLLCNILQWPMDAVDSTWAGPHVCNLTLTHFVCLDPTKGIYRTQDGEFHWCALVVVIESWLFLSLSLSHTYKHTQTRCRKVMSLSDNRGRACPHKHTKNTLRGKEQAWHGIWLSQQCHIGSMYSFIRPARGPSEHMAESYEAICTNTPVCSWAGRDLQHASPVWFNILIFKMANRSIKVTECVLINYQKDLILLCRQTTPSVFCVSQSVINIICVIIRCNLCSHL